MPGTQLWVNAYEVEQRFGGHEEGGWFFDVGTPIYSQQALCHCEEYTHAETCPITHLLVDANAFVQRVTTGWDSTFISRDPEEPEHHGERGYGKTAVRIETSCAKAYRGIDHYE